MSDSATVPALPTPGDPWGYRDRRVVVTGAASGIGKAACEVLIALGAEVFGADIQAIEVEGIAAAHHLDLADPTSVDAVATAIDGPIDALFNCAGIPGTADPTLVLTVNFVGMRRFTEQLVPHMPAGSAICCIGSTAAVNWTYHACDLLDAVAADDATTLRWFDAHLAELGYPYDVSKEAVNVYAAWRAISLNPLGIRINCINPGGTFTPSSRAFAQAVKSKHGGAEMIEHWPQLLGRMAVPSEQAWPMVFLNSPLASFVNGACIYVDAGLTSGMFTAQHHEKLAAGMFWSPPTPSGRYLRATHDEPTHTGATPDREA